MPNPLRKAVFTAAVCALAHASASPAKWISAGPFGGNAEVITASKSDPGLLLAGTKNANLFISRDAGSSWQSMPFPRQYGSMLHTVVIHPRNPSIFYAAIADEPRSGLYRSTDAGKSWTALPGLGGEEVYSVAIWDKDPNVIAAGLRLGVRLSRDGGETWRAISPGDNIELQPVVSVAFDPENSDVIYAGTPRLPWKTTDSGEHWELSAEGMSTDSDIITVRVDPTRSSRVFIGACSGFWRSNNGGGMWSKMAGIPFTSRRTYAFAQDPEHPEVIFAGTSRGLYRTLDNGGDWRNVASHEIKSLAISRGVLYVATADSGLFKSTDRGATFQAINDGFTSRNFARVSEAGEHLYTGTGFEMDAGAVFASADGGLHWEEVAAPSVLGNESVLAVARMEGETLVAATASAVFRSTDVGKTWSRVKNAPVHVTTLAVAGRFVLAGSDSGVYRSTDEAQTWKLVAAKQQPVRSLVGSNSHFAVLPQGLLVSDDGGATWENRHLPFFCDIYDVAAVGDLMLAGTSRGVFRSEDQGMTWRSAHSGLPTASITSVAIDPREKSRTFAFEYGNVYESLDGGDNWKRFGAEGLQGAFVRNFVITREGPHNLVAVTATRGIFVRELHDEKSIPASFSAVDSRKEIHVPNQQNDKTPAL